MKTVEVRTQQDYIRACKVIEESKRKVKVLLYNAAMGRWFDHLQHKIVLVDKPDG